MRSSSILTSIQAGHSVLLHVAGFQHYFYVAAPISFQQDDCEPYQMFLESQCQKEINRHSAIISSVQMTMKENILKYQGNQKSPYLKITVTDPDVINRVRSLVQRGDANYKQLWPRREDGILTFDNIAYVLRFMIDTGVSASVSDSKKVVNWLGCRNVVGRSPGREV